MSPLLAQIGHPHRIRQCLLLGVKRTLVSRSAMSAFDPKRTLTNWGGAEIVVVEQSTMLLTARQVIAEAAAAKKLPTLYGYNEHVEVGGLVSYGVKWIGAAFGRRTTLKRY